MKAISETNRSHQVEVHYVNTGVPGVVEERYEGYTFDSGDLSPEEVLLQEIVYESLQTNAKNDRASTSVNSESNVSHERSGDRRQVRENKEESSEAVNAKSQLELDEALAMALQQMEIQVENGPPDATTGREDVNREVNHSNTSNQAVREDNIDPDNMTYEELQSLGETIGVADKGLSDELISYLPSFKYKTGFFSKKENHEECVICYTQYKNRDMLTTLPCKHQYHSKCIAKWLRLNKACPVCTVEVFGS